MTEPATSRTSRRIIENARAVEDADGEPTEGRAPGDMRIVIDFSDVLTYRTLAQIDDTLPAPLLLGLLEPDGPTMMYGPPGVGKGMTAAWLVVELLKAGRRPMIYDAEARPREWSRRVSGLGGEAARWRVGYMGPADLGAARAGRPLWENVDALHTALTATGSDVLIVDSALPAIGVGEDRLKSDAQAPYLFVQALDSLGVPSLTLGHPPKGSSDGDPFGSMAWVAAMRLTWLGQRAEGGGGQDSAGNDLHRVRWLPRKRNERGEIPGVLLTFRYAADGRLEKVERDDDAVSTRNAVLNMLLIATADGSGGLTLAEIVDQLLADADDRVTPSTIEATRGRVARMLNRAKHGAKVTLLGAVGVTRTVAVSSDRGGGPRARWVAQLVEQGQDSDSD